MTTAGGRAPETVRPLYADGPLKGRDFKPDQPTRGVVAMDGENPVMYHFHKLVLLGRVIWIGAIGPVDEIADDDLFDLIVSDRAKQASERP